jgi:ABC-type antimicrobial peptide transport system permease subunit
MYYRIALKNLKSQKSRTILTAIGVAIGTASLLGIVAFSTGIKTAVIDTITASGPLTQITVQPKTEEAGFLKSLSTIAKEKDVITEEIAQKIERLPHVKSVHPEINYENLSSLRINIWGQSFQTDTLIFGVPYEFLEDDLPDISKKQWETLREPYPAVISTRILDLYNLTVAPTNNLPSFTTQDIQGLEFTLLPGQSTFFPQLSSDMTPIKAKIVGFSDRVDMVGVTLPLELIRNLNKKYNPEYKEIYLKLFVNVDDKKNVEAVTATIENMDLRVRSTQMEIRIFEKNFRIVTVGLSLISAIILLVSGLMIANTFLSSVNERRREIGLLRALGATRRDIQKIFLAEASVLGLIGGLAGLFFCWLGGFIVDAIALSAFPDVTSKPNTLIIYEFQTVIGVLIFAIILSVVFAFLPSTKAAHLEPLKALSN